jgi:sugar phosphate isomerase/epimerase
VSRLPRYPQNRALPRETFHVRIALRENMTPGETLPEKLEWLERIGLDGIELHTLSLAMRPDDVVRIFEGSPVRAANLAGSPNLLHRDRGERLAAVELTRRRLELAGALSSTGVLVVPQFGRLPDLPNVSLVEAATNAERDLLVEQLRDLAPAADAAGVSLFLEPLNRYEAHLVNRIEQGAAIAELAGSHVATMADFFHMNIEEADIPSSIRAVGRQIVYVHVADSNRLQPGRGHLDLGAGLAALKEIGYDGWLGIECRLDGPPESAVAESAALLRDLWVAA